MLRFLSRVKQQVFNISQDFYLLAKRKTRPLEVEDNKFCTRIFITKSKTNTEIKSISESFVSHYNFFYFHHFHKA